MNSSSVELTVPPGPETESAEVVLIDPRSEGPIRAERLGLERLEAYAARLAAACVLAPARRASSPLLRRFVENKRVLIEVHGKLVALGDRRRPPGHRRRMALDNFHIIDDSLREVPRDLPPGYDELLPKLGYAPLDRLSARLRAGPGAGRPQRQRAGRGADRPVRPGVPGSRPPDHRRALGVAHHAPAGPPGEPQATVGADGLGLGGTPPRRAVGERGAWHCRRRGQDGARRRLRCERSPSPARLRAS